jgi:glycerol-3-phosphate O-acyltransferase / dihydroxyacetone phosphate acyltransferase
VRRLLTALFRRLLTIFFKRVEVSGVENIPRESPVIFAVNHPNGLVDPLFIIGYVPRRVSFLAKAPLFKMPVIGYIVRALESVPVYRKQDNMAGTHAETFLQARKILGSGGAIAIFPEGTTHSDARLREFKTGAARIALGSSLPGVQIVPAGIYYSDKQTFRSKALIYFGKPIACAPPADVPSTAGEPEPAAVHALTDQIETGLAELTLQADSHAALEVIGLAEDIFTADDEQPLAEELELRRRFVAGYHGLRERDPARLARLESEIRRFASELGRAGLEPHELVPRMDIGTLLRVMLLFPVAGAGALLHFIPYVVVDFLAKRFARGQFEMTATIKFIAGLAFYPVTWLLIAGAAWRWWGPVGSLAALITVPLTGFASLIVMDDLDDAIGRLRAVWHRLFSRDAHARLVAQRRAIRLEIATLEEELGMA